MSIFTQQRTLGARAGRFAFSLLLVLTGAAYAADSVGEEELKQYQDDCRLEGEAGGLSGTYLDDYVADCVKTLTSVEVKNLHQE